MRLGLTLFLSALFAFGAGQATAAQTIPCDAVPGLDLVEHQQDLRYLILGEVHGTVETPALVGDILCNVSEDRSVVLALELPTQIQDDIDAYVASSGDAQARQILFKSRYWSPELADGRSSAAMVTLLDRARGLKSVGRSITVLASRGYAGRLGADSTDLITAAVWTQAAVDHPDALILILVGRAHASKVPSERLRPAASLLPGDKTVTLTVSAAGRFWGCVAAGCGEQLLDDQAASLSPGVSLRRGDGFDGVYAFSSDVSPSPPAVTLPR